MHFFLVVTEIPLIATNGLYVYYSMEVFNATVKTLQAPMQPIVSKSKSQLQIQGGSARRIAGKLEKHKKFKFLFHYFCNCF